MQGWGLGCGCLEGKRAAFGELGKEQTLKTLVMGANGIRLYPQNSRIGGVYTELSSPNALVGSPNPPCDWRWDFKEVIRVT